ncbi:MAG: glycoside hydrolase family 2 TIM barrel-domain containing protein [Bacteroidota bacterium]
MKNLFMFSIALILLPGCSVKEQNNSYITLLDKDWMFSRDSVTGAEKAVFDDSKWRKIDVPHDYSIEDIAGTNSPFDSNAIGGVSTGFTKGGTAWYRKSLAIPGYAKGKSCILQFDGIYMNANIYLNGALLGNHPYGYTSFWYDISEKLNFNGPNILAVEVRNEGRNSRWYSGSGIYRHVWLRVTGKQHVAQWGTSITTPEVGKDSALVIIKSKVKNQSAKVLQVKLITRILNVDGKEINNTISEQMIGKEGFSEYVHKVIVKKPGLWSTETPILYTAISEVYSSGQLADSTITRFGIRTIKIDAVNGFQLNGISMKLKGGCFHADNGPLGSKSYDRAEERRVELMKASGFNAIRCSHNPPSPAFLDACDRLGLLVIDETFDMWKDPKNPQDYNLYFDEWWQRDIESMVLRDRNHPSVIMWSIGNEIPGRHKPEVVEVARILGNFVRELDPTRPVTSAVNELRPDKDPFFATLDIAGYNYATGGDHNQKSLYREDHNRVPERIMVGLESYPLVAFGAWMDVIDNTYVIGDFVWTGFDYIGEAGIGWRGYPQEKNFFPWNLAYCGDIDICGWKRPQSFYRDVLWMKDQVSIFVKPPKPSFEPNPKIESWSKWNWFDVVADWNWKGFENRPFEVTVYSSCEEVELFLNNKSLGKKKTDRSTKFQAVWEVSYQAGELKAIGYKGIEQINTAFLRTAGEPAQIKLIADRTEIKADGQDLSYVTLEITDENGIRNPKAENMVKFEIEGSGTIIGVGNANPISTESYIASERKTWQGRCLVIIKSDGNAGEIKLTARAEGFNPSTIKIVSK